MDHHEEEQVIVIDPIKNKIKERIKVGTGQHLAHVVLDQDSKYAYVTGNESNQIIKISVDKMKEIGRIDLGGGHKPHGLRYHNGKLYVANMEANSISIVDVNSNGVEEIAVGGMAVQTAVSPDGRYVFASLYDTKEIARMDASNKQVTKISLPPDSEGPIQLYATPDSRLLFVCDQGGLSGRKTSNKVYIIDINTSAVVNTIVTGNKAHGVVIDDEGKRAYITNSDDNTVTVVDISSQSVVSTISVGKAPNGIACWHNHGSYGGQP